MTKKRKKMYIRFSIYFLIVLAYTIFPPLVSLWNKLEPHVLGLAYAQFTVIVCSLLLCAGLFFWFKLEGKLNDEEKAMRERGEKLDY